MAAKPHRPACVKTSHSESDISKSLKDMMASHYAMELNTILLEKNKYAVTVILNRPEKLNSLNLTMVLRISKAIQSYETDPDVKIILLKGRGKAFCAGGDLAILNAGHWTLGATFYSKQMTLGYQIATCKKPIVPIIDGPVMGGGAGLSLHRRIQIVTENTIFAMPEVGIGLFPDVGISHMLSRLPGSFGEYLGLTGGRIDGREMVAWGIASHFVLSKDLPLLEKALSETPYINASVIPIVIDGFAQKISANQAGLHSRLEIINKCFSRKTVEEILKSLANEAANRSDGWVSGTIALIKKASPTSLKIALRVIREARTMTLEQCLTRDHKIFCYLLKGEHSNEFHEGARASVFDKDKNPKWNPSTLELVTEEMVDRYFVDMGDDDFTHLELAHLSSASRAIAKL